MSSARKKDGQVTIIKRHGVHLGVLYALQPLTELRGDLPSLVICLNLLLRAWDPETETAAHHHD